MTFQINEQPRLQRGRTDRGCTVLCTDAWPLSQCNPIQHDVIWAIRVRECRLVLYSCVASRGARDGGACDDRLTELVGDKFKPAASNTTWTEWLGQVVESSRARRRDLSSQCTTSGWLPRACRTQDWQWNSWLDMQEQSNRTGGRSPSGCLFTGHWLAARLGQSTSVGGRRSPCPREGAAQMEARYTGLLMITMPEIWLLIYIDPTCIENNILSNYMSSLFLI